MITVHSITEASFPYIKEQYQTQQLSLLQSSSHVFYLNRDYHFTHVKILFNYYIFLFRFSV